MDLSRGMPVESRDSEDPRKLLVGLRRELRRLVFIYLWMFKRLGAEHPLGRGRLQYVLLYGETVM